MAPNGPRDPVQLANPEPYPVQVAFTEPYPARAAPNGPQAPARAAPNGLMGKEGVGDEGVVPVVHDLLGHDFGNGIDVWRGSQPDHPVEGVLELR